ncbi:methionine synthase [Actinoplanes sp. ATCC 53533]|nr:methionine synthase [Actinoplanes sp. ATCC 53533]
MGELPDLPHLAELPNRGPGSDLIGRTAGLLAELPVQLYVGRWQMAPRPGKDQRHIADLLERDLDQLSEQADRFAGTIKVQAAGPWTLAANLDLPIGGRMLRDAGAVRHLTESLGEGLRSHVADLRKRLPLASLLLQLDEPSLPAVLAGHIPTESGLSAYHAVDGPDAATGLRTIVEAVGVPVIVHCCAPDVPLQVFRDARVAAATLDLSLIKDLDPLGEALEAGLGLFAGAAPTRPPADGRALTSAQVAERVRKLWSRLGFPAARLPQQVVITPACGLAGASQPYVREVLKACRDAGRRLAEV